MFDELLPFYNDELRFMRELAGNFADAHPKIAGRLRLSREAIEDPHVARLIEAFAFLNSRIRHKLEDDFPELTHALLGVLYPHFLCPIPSMAVARFNLDDGLDGPQTVAAGTEIETEPVGGEVCSYRTGYDVTLWPIKMVSATISGQPLPAPANPRAPGATACLRLKLACLSSEMTFTELGFDRLRCYLHAEPRTAQILYELIANNVVSVALADSSDDPSPVILDADCIRPVGFEPDEVLLPLAKQSLPSYGLLTEYFAFPEKFLFFDIVNLTAKTLLSAGNELEIYLYFSRCDPNLERSVTKEMFQLFCSPIINLFAVQAEPIRLDNTRNEYRVVPDARRESTQEVYSVNSVVVNRRGVEEIDCKPLYGPTHAASGDLGEAQLFWHGRRQTSTGKGGGDDLYLSIVDLEDRLDLDDDDIASLDIICTNRDLPSKLPFGGGRPHLDLLAGEAGVQSLECLTPPTQTIRPDRGKGVLWKLISHLSLNHLSLSDDQQGLDALKEILTLHHHINLAEGRSVVDRIAGISSAPAVARAPHSGRVAFCCGTEINLVLDDDRFSGTGAFLLSSIMERFFSNYCAINSFTRLSIQYKSEKGVVRRWPARAGGLLLT